VRAFAVSFVLLAMVVGLSNCGGGSSSGVSTPMGPVAESGVVSVVGTSGVLSNGASVAVTVQ